MIDLDTALRDLSDSALGAPAAPDASGMDVRLAAGRRRRRRHLAGAGGAALATIGLVAAAAAWNPLASTTPGDPAGTTQFTPAPGDATLLGNYPKVLVLPAGGTAMATGPDAIAGTAFITDTDCVALRLPPTTAGGIGIATALVLPPGTTSSESRLEPGPQLGDGRVIPQGSQVSGTGTAHPDDDRYAAACPGTQGFVELNRPDLIAWEPPAQTAGPNAPTDGFTGATGVTWQTRLGDVALTPDAQTSGDRTVVGPGRDVTIDPPLGLVPSTTAKVLDQISAQINDPAATQIRFVALYGNDIDANDALLAWAEAAKLASGTVVTGPPNLTSTYAVTTDRDDLLITQTLRDETGALYAGCGHLGIRRIGNALLVVSSTSEAKATPDNVNAWTTADRELLATLGKGLCRFTATGCD